MVNRKLGVSVGVVILVLMVSTLTSNALANSGKGLKVYVYIHNVQNEVDMTVNGNDYTMHDRLFATGTATAYFEFPPGVVGVGDKIGACAHESGQPSNRDCGSTYNSEAKKPEYIDLYLSGGNSNSQSQLQQDQSQSQSQAQNQENNNVINIYPDSYYR